MAPVLVPTACEDWSLNIDDDSEKRFWWNNTYSITLWEETLSIDKQTETITDGDVWSKFIDLQLQCAFKICSICHAPEGNEDMKVCCYCGNTVHVRCSEPATPEQIMWKPSNLPYQEHMRACFQCQAVEYKVAAAAPQLLGEKDSARRAAKRALTVADEYSPATVNSLRRLLQRAEATPSDAGLLSDLQSLMQSFFQSPQSLGFLCKRRVASKGDGVGVVAAKRIPAFSIIGVYPGYLDFLSGEQAKYGRPVPKYALMEYNCADYFNDVFVELQSTFTPFINEPNVDEKSNCAWIQEPHRKNGRLSVICVRDIDEGEELTIGYGPVYPRTYPYCYDAYACHTIEGHAAHPCYSLWHWPTLQEADARFICYIGYIASDDRYSLWKSEA
ncbi:SET domain containing protein [Novymonas esmeraldas]|uniref:SET domain containing protein n=1 Tax=Novymonas esmeraldas TaxID=1808958 RepID=A0AAW0ERH0_9TRYP